MISETNKDWSHIKINEISATVKGLSDTVAYLSNTISLLNFENISIHDKATINNAEIQIATIQDLIAHNETVSQSLIENLNASVAHISKLYVSDLDLQSITIPNSSGEFTVAYLGDFDTSPWRPDISVNGTLQTTQTVSNIPIGTDVTVTGTVTGNSGMDNIDNRHPAQIFLQVTEGINVYDYIVMFDQKHISIPLYSQRLSTTGIGEPISHFRIHEGTVAGTYCLTAVTSIVGLQVSAKFINCYYAATPWTPDVVSEALLLEYGSYFQNMSFSDLSVNNLNVMNHTELNTVHAFDLIADNLTIDNITFTPDNFNLISGWYQYDILTKGVGEQPGTQNSSIAFFYFYDLDQIGPDDKPISGESPKATIIFNKSMEKTFMINSSNVQFYMDRYGYNVLGSSDPDYIHIIQNCHLEVMLVSERAVILLEATSDIPSNSFLMSPGMITNTGNIQNLVFSNAIGPTLTITDSLSFPDGEYEKISNRLNTLDDQSTGGGSIPASTQYAGGQGVLNYFNKKIIRLESEAAFNSLVTAGNLVPDTLYFYPDLVNNPSILIDDSVIANNKTWSSYHIDDVISHINQLLSAMSVSGIFIGSYNFYDDNPTDTQFTTWVLTQRPSWTTPRDGATVVNIFNNHQWRFDSTGIPRQWIDMGQAFVSIATDMNAGITLSTVPVNNDLSTFGTVSVGSTGKMNVNNIYLEDESQYNPNLLGLHLRIQEV